MLEKWLAIGQDEVDKRATRKRVESLLEAVRLSQSLRAVRLGQSPSAEKIAESSGGYGDASEELVCAQVEQALLQLDEQEQAVIRGRYLHKNQTFDYMLCYELHLSERTYRRVKARAMDKLTYMLRAEVMRESIGR
ncbi:hypothetical protein [Bacillus sp. 3255]|uniref:hypothetical protein n=1 Tax=Bacillus sp. 3255 TaxID=2817904 RepID=UPI00285F5A9E|nr:hypothetical protein [Bacillus sp. 3255]MDR6878617.1 ArpU family phage transcriptional regulator [Bacillus sp. 3255]